MSKLYQLIKQGSRICYKIRHHNGHGIHSPFVFSLINDVIEEKRSYYAYSDIADFIWQTAGKTDRKAKINKLLFRLVNRFKPSTILEIGTGNGISTLYLTATKKENDCYSIGSTREAQIMHQKWDRGIQYLNSLESSNLSRQDFMYVNLTNIEYNDDKLAHFLKNHVHLRSVIIIDGIRLDKTKQLFWKRVVSNDSVRISLDLYDLGILFFDRKYFKKNYKLSF